MNLYGKPDPKTEAVTTTAMRKVGAKDDNELCRYIPATKGSGYIHHFSLRKLRSKDPEHYTQLLNKYVVNHSAPEKLPPKTRAPRGSRKRRELLALTKQDIDLLLSLARQSGQKEIVRKLNPPRELRALRRELLASIRRNEVKEDLWLSYSEAIAAAHAPAATH